MPYFSETLTYSSGIDEPELSASANSRKNPSNPAGVELQEPARSRHCPPLRMRNAARPEDYPARADMKLVIANLNNVLSFEHVPQFVFILMDVKRGVERVNFFDDGDRSASRIGRRLYDEICVAESEAFTAVCIELEAGDPCHDLKHNPWATTLAGVSSRRACFHSRWVFSS
jgi:hypothetical protein